MNVLLRSLTIIALSACCVQIATAKTQPVRASKKDLRDAKVTVKIIYPNGEEKSSTFTKNTDGILQKKLHFDFAGGDNKIEAFYNDDANRAFGLIVSQQDAPEKSEIIINEYTVTIDKTKAKKQEPEQKAEEIVAVIKVPSDSGPWTVVTGTQNLTASIAGSGNTHPAILKRAQCDAATRCTISIYEGKLTKIYAKQIIKNDQGEIVGKPGATGKITSLKPGQITQASSPVIVIDEKGAAKIFTKAHYEAYEVGKQKKQTPTVTAVKPAEPIVIAATPPTPSQPRQGKDVPALLQRLANKEKIEMPGAVLFNANLKDAHLENANLKDATLTEAILIGAHLAGADLSQTEKPRPHKGRGRVWHRSLSKANLTGADLTGAKLMNQSFRRAILTDADLTGADLTGADFEQSSDLTKVKSWHKANLSGVGGFSDKEIEYARSQGALNTPKTSSEREEERKEAEEARLPADERRQRAKQKEDEPKFKIAVSTGQKIDMPHAELQKVRLLPGADLKGANLKGANLNSATLNGVHLEGAILIGAELKFAELKGAHLEGAQLQNADLLRIDLSDAHLAGANLYQESTAGNGLYSSNLRNADFTNADLRNVTLSRSNLTGVILTGAQLNGAKLKDVRGLTAEQEQYARAQGAREVSRYREPTAAERQASMDETMNYP